MMKFLKMGGWVLLLLACFVGSAIADILVIANRSVPAASLSKDDVKRIYLGSMSRWEDGSRVNFVVLKDDTMDAFLSAYVGTSSSQFAQHWKRQVFTGKGQMPPMYDKSSDVVKFVANTPGAIGFVPEETRTDEVKVLGVNP